LTGLKIAARLGRHGRWTGKQGYSQGETRSQSFQILKDELYCGFDFLWSSRGAFFARSASPFTAASDSVTIPRIDAYYRFNERHRIDFSSFRTKRDGLKTIEIDIDLGTNLLSSAIE